MKRKPSQKIRSLAPRKPIRKRNVKRAKANQLRAYGEKAAWIRRQPCCVPTTEHGDTVHAAHTSGSAGKKGDSATLVPLCGPKWAFPTVEGHHNESHRGIKTFQAKYGVDLKALAVEYETRWQEETSR